MNVVAITGGRGFNNRGFIFRCLDWAHAQIPIGLLVHGGATGVDTIGNEWAIARDVPCKVFLADWDNLEGVPIRNMRKRADGSRYNVKAGFERNEIMANYPRLTHGLIFPGGNGTMDMAGRLKDRLGIRNVHDFRGSFLK